MNIYTLQQVSDYTYAFLRCVYVCVFYYYKNTKMEREIQNIQSQMESSLSHLNTVKCDKNHEYLTQDCIRCKQLIQFAAYLRLAIRKSRKILQPELPALSMNRWIYDTEVRAENFARHQAKAMEM